MNFTCFWCPLLNSKDGMGGGSHRRSWCYKEQILRVLIWGTTFPPLMHYNLSKRKINAASLIYHVLLLLSFKKYTQHCYVRSSQMAVKRRTTCGLEYEKNNQVILRQVQFVNWCLIHFGYLLKRTPWLASELWMLWLLQRLHTVVGIIKSIPT